MDWKNSITFHITKTKDGVSKIKFVANLSQLLGPWIFVNVTAKIDNYDSVPYSSSQSYSFLGGGENKNRMEMIYRDY